MAQTGKPARGSGYLCLCRCFETRKVLNVSSSYFIVDPSGSVQREVKSDEPVRRTSMGTPAMHLLNSRHMRLRIGPMQVP